MRSSLALSCVFVVSSLVFGQQPAQTQAPLPPLDPANNRLDAMLLQWEQKMKTVDSLSAEITRVRDDKVFRSREVFEGRAKYMKPNLALLDMRLRGKPNVFERYVCTGNFLYEYKQADKVLRVHQLPPPKAGQVADDNFLSFMFGMKAQEAKRRYDLKLAHEDKNYYYMEIVPRFEADKADFQKARLVLNKDSFLPRQLSFLDSSNNQTTWDIPRIENGAVVNRNEFLTPALPPGWKAVRMPLAKDSTDAKEPQPRLYRPKQ